MSKIRQSAKGETCTFQIPGVCNNNPETVVLCHAPHPDKGMGIKGPDYFAAYGCSACHDAMDGRSKFPGYYEGSPEIKDLAVRSFWLHAVRETQRRLAAKNLLRFG